MEERVIVIKGGWRRGTWTWVGDLVKENRRSFLDSFCFFLLRVRKV